MYIDTHTHLYSSKFSEDRPAVMERARTAGVDLAILPAVDHTSHEDMLALEAAYADWVLAMIGLHPVSVGENFAEELAIVEQYLQQRRWVAIGEIGMDLYWDKTFREEQVRAFLQQCNWAIEYDLPICIHAREAIDELLELIQEVDNPKLRGVFHCFTGDVIQARQAIDLGFYLGIGGVATFKNGGLEPVLTTMPRDRIVLETDAPYLAPAPKRGKRNETAYVAFVAEKIASLWETSAKEVGRQTSHNAWQLFELDRFVKPESPWRGLRPPVKNAINE